MNPKQILRQQFLDTVENQLRDNDPPETAETLKRLILDGYNEQEAKELISACVAAEIYAVLQSNEPFNRNRYIEWLNKLPDLPD